MTLKSCFFFSLSCTVHQAFSVPNAKCKTAMIVFQIDTLLEIWQEYRAETQEQLICHRLPEPPAVRDRLKQEILFFVESLRQKATEKGR